MKNLVIVVVMLLVGSLIGIAMAGTSGGIAPAVGKVNVPLTVPKVSKSICTNLAAGKTSTVSLDVSGTTMVNWNAFNSDTDATAVTLKRKFNTNSAYMPSSGDKNLPIEANASTIVFGRFSSLNNQTTPKICAELN